MCGLLGQLIGDDINRVRRKKSRRRTMTEAVIFKKTNFNIFYNFYLLKFKKNVN